MATVDPTEKFRTWSSQLTIQELTAPGPGKQPRKLVFVGSGLPFMGAAWGVKNVVITDWYPGNGSEGTQQVLGPQELPSVWEGRWARTMLGRAPIQYTNDSGAQVDLVDPDVVAEVMEDITRVGSRLRVTWAVNGLQFRGKLPESVDVKRAREGRLVNFETPVDRHTDFRWKMEFHWVSRLGTTSKVLALRADPGFSTGAQQVKTSASKLAKASAVNRDTLGALESLADTPRRLTEGVVAAVDQGVQQLNQAGNVVRRASNVGKNVLSQPDKIAQLFRNEAQHLEAVSRSYSDILGRKSPEQYSKKDTVRSVLNGAKYFGGTTDASRDIAHNSQQLRVQATQAIVSGPNRGRISTNASQGIQQGDFLATYVAKLGDTPQRVSMKFYGTADHGVGILQANRLPWHLSTFEKGQIVIIPSLGSGTGG